MMMISRKTTLLLLALLPLSLLTAQPDRWMQKVDYQMEIDFDVATHRFSGQQRLAYSNNSPDALERVFYHLYFNAFQPGSMMSVRTTQLPDGDKRIKGRIEKMNELEIGYQKITSLKMDGLDCAYEVVGTILEVQLPRAIPAGGQVIFEMEFEAQVPLQVRRSGRDNSEGISYSMSQWYPKLCEYDYQGWHSNPYIGREFHGVWGDFDVSIKIDKRYTVGGTGVLQNPDQVGYGYEAAGLTVAPPSGPKTTWRFVAENVHDFVWAADPDYTHTTYQAKDGPLMHFLYQKNESTEEVWALLPGIMDRAFSYINQTYGKYPYPVYSFIQGGDGGMEYPMATLITGERSLNSLVGVSVHELMHSWYQMILGTNESLYAWMDEGFTSYASDEVMNYLAGEGLLPGRKQVDNPHLSSYQGFVNFVKSGLEEPLSTHADHFETNAAYGVGSYVKGAIFLHQLEYVVGEDAFDRGMLEYFNTWKFKHPNPNDFIRVMEKVSGLELDWYKEYFVYTTKTTDYGVLGLKKGEKGKESLLQLRRSGKMPMPLDIEVTLTNGKKEYYNVPLRIMRGEKAEMAPNGKPYVYLEDWPWTFPEYTATLPLKFKNIASVRIDPSSRMLDVDLKDNQFDHTKSNKNKVDRP
ncbi:MAG: M1 family metallopeptidase [Bacteroidota bacterium]